MKSKPKNKQKSRSQEIQEDSNKYNPKSRIKTFLASRFNRYLIIVLILLGAYALFFNSNSDVLNMPTQVDTNSKDSSLTITFFYTPTCPYCQTQKPILNEIEREFENITVFKYDASTQKGSQIFYETAKAHNIDSSGLGVPALFIGETFLVGLQTKETIVQTILDEQNATNPSTEYIYSKTKDSANTTIKNTDQKFKNFDLPFFGEVDLTKWSLPFLAIVLGLIDGFNPCALWVLIFLITMLLGEKSKKKIWLVVGSFVLASAISYFLFMTAWLNLFLLMGYIGIVTLMIGLFALAMGALQLKDFFTTKGDLTCKVTDEEGKEKTMNKIQNIIYQPITISVIIAVIGLAFTVNAIEFVCSAAIPAVFTQVLALSGISTIQHYMYIILYVFFYMLDHILIFSMAAFALGSGFSQKYAKVCKLLGGIIMLILGLIMVLAPHLLR